MLTRLPIDPMLPQIAEALHQYNALILKASPGAGKTTRVPSHLLREPWLKHKKILVLEPRRLAAKLSAMRVAEESGTTLGDEIGYEFRFERKSSPRSKLVFLTEGLLMRKFLKDPELKDIGIVILDEFHERHVHADIALALLKNLQNSKRPDLKIVVMSATMDSAQLSEFLKDAPVLTQELPPHPLEVLHLESSEDYLDKKCLKGVRLALDSKYSGDILVFLPGMAEIKRAENAIQSQKFDNVRTYILHGEASSEEQKEALAPNKGVRKIILSTNIAETSVTIPGVNIVIDSGVEKRSVVDEWTQITELKTKKISQASARQRMGRAARTGAGLCIRLYSKAEYDSLLPYTPPEIQRSDLTRTYLELLAIGIENPESFPWYEAPRANLLTSAQTLLQNLDALDKQGKLTSFGKEMAEIPASPRISRVLLEAKKQKCLEDCAWLVAGLSEGQLRGGEIYTQLNELKRNFFLNKTVNQLILAVGKGENTLSSEETLTTCLLHGFADRVGKRKNDTTARHTEYVLASGGVAWLEKEKAPDSPFLLILEARKNDFNKVFIHSYCPLSLEEIFDQFSESIVESVESKWDKEKERVVSFSRMTYGNLILMESKVPTPREPQSARLLLQEGLGISETIFYSLKELSEKLARVCPEEVQSTALARIELFQRNFPTEDSIPLNEKTFYEFLVDKALGHYSSQSLKELDWKNDLASYFLPMQFSRLEQKLPEFLALSNGRRMKITYALGSAPKTSIKIQELFGLRQIPAIADGKIQVLLEILGPNYRPVQVTSDLPGFWERAYPILRKELSRKYPRHKWPEDPLVVQPITQRERK